MTDMVEMNVERARIRFCQAYIESLVDVIQNVDLKSIADVISVLESAWENNIQVFTAGNGGSAATASHICADLVQTVVQRAPGQHGFRVMCLNDNVSTLTALANDKSYSEVFAIPLRTFASRGDVLILISGSGNSLNVVRAAEVARELGVITIGLLGMGGGELVKMVDLSVVVPSDDYGPIEDMHMVLDHLITAYFRDRLNNTARPRQLGESDS